MPIEDEQKWIWVSQYARSIQYRPNVEWAKMWGVSRETVMRIVKEHAREIREIREDVRKQAIAGLSNLIPKATENVNRILDESKDDKTILDCVEKVYKYAVGSKQSVDAVVEHKTSGIRELLSDEVKDSDTTSISAVQPEPDGSDQ